MTLNPALEIAAQVVWQRSASLAGVRRMSDDNRFSRALQALDRMATECDLPLAIVGGMAGIHHGANVTTVDIDLVSRRADGPRLLAVARQYGLAVRRESPHGWHGLTFPDPAGDVEIHIVPEGGKSPRDPESAPATPSPAELGVPAGLGFATFSAWVLLKLVANRDKDRYHLTEALQRADESRIAAAVVEIRRRAPQYLPEFERLVRAAEDQRQDNW